MQPMHAFLFICILITISFDSTQISPITPRIVHDVFKLLPNCIIRISQFTVFGNVCQTRDVEVPAEYLGVEIDRAEIGTVKSALLSAEFQSKLHLSLCVHSSMWPLAVVFCIFRKMTTKVIS